MDINALQAFVEVARQGSFSKAADLLFVTQPAVSKRIAALEDELQARLFDRIGKNITLTETGGELLPRARRLLLEADEMKRIASSLSTSVGGRLLMGTSHHIGLHRLPPVLKAFHNQYPKVILDLRFMDSEQAFQAVEQGELELAIVTLPSATPPNLEVQTIWIDLLEVVTAADHPLASQQQVSLQTLAEYPAVLPGPQTYTRQILQQELQRLGLKLDTTLSTNYLETLKMLVMTGLGWSLLPNTMIDGKLHKLKTELKIERQLGSVIHHKRTLSNAARAMLSIAHNSK
ncbi:MAG: LysR family transcriptional regulator [Pseudomonadota bacterium]|nr:LysR family transcriptional regulator [Pseudomonadota bacterium]